MQVTRLLTTPPPAPVAKPIVLEEQPKPAPRPAPQPVVHKAAPPNAKFNATLTLKECYNSRLDEREEIVEVDEASEDLMKELARGFIRSTKR